MSAPQSRPDPQQASRELHTWKEIAEYLSVTPRTAQLWERDRGLPVRRLPGEGGRVLARTSELERWKLGPEQADDAVAPRRRPVAWLVLALVAMAATATGWFFWPRSYPQAFRLEENSVIALDGEGRELWRYTLPPTYYFALGAAEHSKQVDMADVDGDGRNEILASAMSTQASAENNARLICISGGKERWRFSAGRHVRSGDEDHPLPFLISSFRVLRPAAGLPPKVVVSSHQTLLYANQVALLDGRTGRLER